MKTKIPYWSTPVSNGSTVRDLWEAKALAEGWLEYEGVSYKNILRTFHRVAKIENPFDFFEEQAWDATLLSIGVIQIPKIDLRKSGEDTDAFLVELLEEVEHPDTTIMYAAIRALAIHLAYQFAYLQIRELPRQSARINMRNRTLIITLHQGDTLVDDAKTRSTNFINLFDIEVLHGEPENGLSTFKLNGKTSRLLIEVTQPTKKED